jgi:hypothetical protein
MEDMKDTKVKENIKLLTLDFLLKVYTEEEIILLLNDNLEINELLNSMLLQEFNNSIPTVSFAIKEAGFIDYTIGSTYTALLPETLAKVFNQLDEKVLLKLMLSSIEKLKI